MIERLRSKRTHVPHCRSGDANLFRNSERSERSAFGEKSIITHTKTSQLFPDTDKEKHHEFGDERGNAETSLSSSLCTDTTKTLKKISQAQMFLRHNFDAPFSVFHPNSLFIYRFIYIVVKIDSTQWDLIRWIQPTSSLK